MGEVGRKPKELNQQKFESLCAIFCTKREIAHFFDCTPATLDRWCERTYGKPYAEVSEKIADIGRVKIREARMKLAMETPAINTEYAKKYLDKEEAEQKRKKTVLDLVQNRHKKEAQ